MPLDLTPDCTFTGPALPEPFVKFNLEAELNRLSLVPKATGPEARALNEHWQFVRRKLRNLVTHGGPLRVQNHVTISAHHGATFPHGRHECTATDRPAGVPAGTLRSPCTEDRYGKLGTTVHRKPMEL